MPRIERFSIPADQAQVTTRSHRAVARVSLVNERDALPKIKQLIVAATKSIDVVAYNFFSESGDVKALAEQLVQKKKDNPNVAIRVFIEGDHGPAAARNQKTVELLKAGGVDVIVDSTHMITHAKGIGIDGHTVLAGSTNLTNTSLGKNNEINALLVSSALAKAWKSYVDALVADPDHLHATKTKSGNVTMLTDDAYYDELMRVVTSSKTGEAIDAVMYYVSDKASDEKTQALLAALEEAQARGVHVRLYLEQDASGFAPDITASNKRVAARLQAKGIEVTFDPDDKITHAKGIVRRGADGVAIEALMGSTNWSKSDFDGRHQVNWLITDANVAGELASWIGDKIANDHGAP